MEVSKLTVSDKTYDLNYLTKKKKTNLRRKAIIEYIQSKPAGELIKVKEFQDVGQFSTPANAYAFVKRMVRDGVLSRYSGERPKTHYYGVTGAMRTVKSRESEPAVPADTEFDFTAAIKNLKKAGLKFTITISNEVQ